MHELSEELQCFYNDQQTVRLMHISKEIDIDFEMSILEDLEEELEMNEFINSPEYREALPNPGRSNYSIQMEDSEDDAEVNTPKPDIRVGKPYKPSVLDAIATISYRACISVAKARVAFQVCCDKFYHHQYYLTKEDQAKSSQDGSGSPTPKKTRTAGDFKKVRYVLPVPKTVANYKHNKALQQEIFAVNAMINKAPSTKIM